MTESYLVTTKAEDYGSEIVYEGNNLLLAKSILEQDRYAELVTIVNGVAVSITGR